MQHHVELYFSERGTLSHPMKQLPARLREAAKAKGLTASDVSRLMPEVSRATVGHWFTGQRQPQLDNLRKLAQILDISAASLVADEPDYAHTSNEKLLLKLSREIDPAQLEAALAVLQSMKK